MDELVHQERLSPNFDERNAPVEIVVLHYTEMLGPDVAIERMCDPQAKVSAHYLIAEDGTVTRLVPEEKRAWHAGVSYWRGHKDINSVSIGIELDHPGHLHGYRDFSERQFEALVPLLSSIMKRHDIPRANVLGHSDVARSARSTPANSFRGSGSPNTAFASPPRRSSWAIPSTMMAPFISRWNASATTSPTGIRRSRPFNVAGVRARSMGKSMVKSVRSCSSS